jgi:hypothetical protein
MPFVRPVRVPFYPFPRAIEVLPVSQSLCTSRARSSCNMFSPHTVLRQETYVCAIVPFHSISALYHATDTSRYPALPSLPPLPCPPLYAPNPLPDQKYSVHRCLYLEYLYSWLCGVSIAGAGGMHYLLLLLSASNIDRRMSFILFYTTYFTKPFYETLPFKNYQKFANYDHGCLGRRA